MRTASIAIVLALVCSITFAQDAAKKPTQQEMMEAMMKFGTPGKQHEQMKAMVGTFDADVTMKMDPQAPEQKSKGKMVSEMIMDGRYLKGDYSGDFMGMPFKGLTITAYDIANEKYVNLWIDSMSTMMMLSEGKAGSDPKVITTACTYDCPIQKEKVSTRQVITVVDNDHHTLDMFCTQGGKEFKMMTIKYTRAKDATAGK